MSTTTPDQQDLSADLAAAHEEIAQLRVALMTRGVIDQAKGILMAQTGCAADDAFDRLRAASMRDNHKLYDVAVRIVASVVTRGDHRSGGGTHVMP
jgi:AmiR/NasT family two-component response regulator